MVKTVDDVREVLSSILPLHPVDRAWLYGSFARCEQTSASDVDLMIEFTDGNGYGLKLFRLKEELEDALGRKVDLGVLPKQNLPSLFEDSYRDERVMAYEA